MDSKAEMVGQVCSISTMFMSCTHRRRNARNSVFVDWYLILQIEEDASVDEIRKRYRQLALQLHPDKNKHPKADVAFKLVSEAYACLSDKARRKAFNSERCHSFCTECSKKAQAKTPVCTTNNSTEKKRSYCRKSTQHARSQTVLQALREAKRRLEEEARIIENCLRNHEASRGEFPLFDPSDNLVFPGYPHNRRVQAPRGFWYLRPGSVRDTCSRKEWCESPIYEVRSGGRATGTRSRDFRY